MAVKFFGGLQRGILRSPQDLKDKAAIRKNNLEVAGVPSIGCF